MKQIFESAFSGGLRRFEGEIEELMMPARDGVRLYTIDVRLRGGGTLRLTVSSDCEDTCFYARLSHVRKDGSCYGLRDDIVSLRRQNPGYIPGGKAEVVLSFTANAILIEKGERLRLDLSSSCRPCFLPHRNTAENAWECSSPAIAHNTVYLQKCSLNLFRSK